MAVRVRREHAELALAELLALAPSGVEEVELDGDVVEYAVYGAPGELPELPELRAAVGQSLVEVRTTELADDWAERWRRFHKPLVLPGRLTVRPPWEPPGTTPLDVAIEPGRAFGTGAHATTRLCLELLLSLEPRGSFLDIGCGSGVLAVVAARRGFEPVTALDNDPAAVEATLANAARNGVELAVVRHDLRSAAPPHAETVAANLLGPLLLILAEQLGEPPQRLIAGGLLGSEAERVAQAFAAVGLREAERREAGEWAALLLERDARRSPGPGLS